MEALLSFEITNHVYFPIGAVVAVLTFIGMCILFKDEDDIPTVSNIFVSCFVGAVWFPLVIIGCICLIFGLIYLFFKLLEFIVVLFTS